MPQTQLCKLYLGTGSLETGSRNCAVYIANATDAIYMANATDPIYIANAMDPTPVVDN